MGESGLQPAPPINVQGQWQAEFQAALLPGCSLQVQACEKSLYIRPSFLSWYIMNILEYSNLDTVCRNGPTLSYNVANKNRADL